MTTPATPTQIRAIVREELERAGRAVHQGAHPKTPEPAATYATSTLDLEIALAEATVTTLRQRRRNLARPGDAS